MNSLFPASEAPQRAPARKAATAFRTISETADELQVPQHVLRFWETKFPQLRPVKRGGGRRYYRPEDLDLLRRISSLLYVEGYTIKAVQRLLRDGVAEDGAEAASDGATENSADETAVENPASQTGLDLSRQEAAAIGTFNNEPKKALSPELRKALGAVLTELEYWRGTLGNVAAG